MPQENSVADNLPKVHNPMTLINPLEGNFFDNRSQNKPGGGGTGTRNGVGGTGSTSSGTSGPGGRRSKDPMEDIFGSVTGKYYLPLLNFPPKSVYNI